MSKATMKIKMQLNQNENRDVLIKVQAQLTNYTDSIKAKK
jgi:hypothetical protein